MISERKLVERWFREGSLERKLIWKQRSIWEPYIHVIQAGKNHPDNGKKFGWRREVARIFISPSGKEYVHCGPHDPVSRTLHFEGLRPVRLCRFSRSALGRRIAKQNAEDERRNSHQRGARR